MSDIDSNIRNEDQDNLTSVDSKDDFNEQPPADIVSFNELRSCSDLFRMYKDEELEIDPDFQRDVVWSRPQQTRFIDSLSKQLPIPSICISLDYKRNKRIVIDGLQRISSIINFLGDPAWELSNLEDIDPRISGKTVEIIRSDAREVYSRVKNIAIPVTVIRCDYDKKMHMEYLFTIFHRLNTGGIKLNNQEIRNCIYSGNFNRFLKLVVQNSDFRSLFALENGKTYRFAYEELVLRVLAHSAHFEDYDGKLSKYLNDFMNEHRLDSFKKIEAEFNYIFEIILRIYDDIQNHVPLKASKSIVEALFVGLARNRDKAYSGEQLRTRYNRLKSDLLFSTEALKEGLAGKDKVIKRLERAVEIFA